MVITPQSSPTTIREQIRVRGIVQGVGFRPTVYRLALERGLSGDVLNDGDGVLIRVKGDRDQLEAFVRALHTEAPPLARIDKVDRRPYEDPIEDGFRIVASQAGQANTAVTPDAATCPACLAEVENPANRRYRYPFTNCTHCGPRLSIVNAIPYDRVNTSMRVFAMCSTCESEYHDPANRRFHAQPNACPICGPEISLIRSNGDPLPDRLGPEEDALDVACRLLRHGEIVAIKGLGGFHLACDATNEKAVARLRARKHRYDKPFALMARDLSVIRRYCNVDPTEDTLLQSNAAPIVLLRISGRERLANSVAPGQTTYGFMLPYTPLHHLLIEKLNNPMVLTSGNVSDEPQCIDNRDAQEKLGGIADYLLLHNREIVNRLDDSVTRVVAGSTQVLRRARGYAPSAVLLPKGFEQAPPVLAFGGELKNTFCLVRDGEAILSQHIGDLEHARAYSTYCETLDLYLKLFKHAPSVVAVDLHPEYLSTKLGKDWARTGDQTLVEVQHHHAHIASCMADNGVPLGAPPVLGIALDGLGFGTDGTLWGGEFLLADYFDFKRLAMFKRVPMPGGTKAIREPWRMAFAYLRQELDWESLVREYGDLKFFGCLKEKSLSTVGAMIDKRLNSPLTSSCGRLFDAVSAVIGLRQEVTYEGQAAIELEAAVDLVSSTQGNQDYTFNIGQLQDDQLASIESGTMWAALLRDAAADIPAGQMAARFHDGLAQVITEMVEQLSVRYSDPWQGRIALSGGVFQNAVLTGELIKRLESSGRHVLTHRLVPANDGGLSLGQAAIAAAQSLQGGS